MTSHHALMVFLKYLLVFVFFVVDVWSLEKCTKWFNAKRFGYGWVIIALLVGIVLGSCLLLLGTWLTHHYLVESLHQSLALNLFVLLIFQSIAYWLILGLKNFFHGVKFALVSLVLLCVLNLAFLVFLGIILFVLVAVLKATDPKKALMLEQTAQKMQATIISAVLTHQEKPLDPVSYFSETANRLCACVPTDIACRKQHSTALAKGVYAIKHILQKTPNAFSQTQLQQVQYHLKRAGYCWQQQSSQQPTQTASGTPSPAPTAPTKAPQQAVTPPDSTGK